MAIITLAKTVVHCVYQKHSIPTCLLIFFICFPVAFSKGCVHATYRHGFTKRQHLEKWSSAPATFVLTRRDYLISFAVIIPISGHFTWRKRQCGCEFPPRKHSSKDNAMNPDVWEHCRGELVIPRTGLPVHHSLPPQHRHYYFIPCRIYILSDRVEVLECSWWAMAVGHVEVLSLSCVCLLECLLEIMMPLEKNLLAMQDYHVWGSSSCLN